MEELQIDSIKVGRKIKKMRVARDLKQEDLAEKLFVSRKCVSKWETGRTIPSIDMLKRISEFFDVSIDELLNTDSVLINKPIKLKTYDFYFEYEGKDTFTSMSVDYSSNKVKSTKTEKGKKIIHEKPIIEFSLEIEDDMKSVYKLDFSLYVDLEKYNRLNSRPTNITNLLVEGETILYDPYTEKFAILDTVSERVLYEKPSCLWVAKFKDGITFFKLFIPEEHLYLWFKVPININKEVEQM